MPCDGNCPSTIHDKLDTLIINQATIGEKVRSLTGNGQPGRVGILEKKVDTHGKLLERIIGGLIVMNILLAAAKWLVK